MKRFVLLTICAKLAPFIEVCLLATSRTIVIR